MTNHSNIGALGNDPAVINEMLRTARTIAVVGMSDKTSRASHHIGRYLAENGYRVFPVNPALSEVLGMKCYPDLDAAQAAAQKQTGAGIDSGGRVSRLGACAGDCGRRDPAGHSLSMAAGRRDSRGGGRPRPRRRSQVRAERLHFSRTLPDGRRSLRFPQRPLTRIWAYLRL